LELSVEVKKLDPQGRITLPADWRKSEVGDSKEVYIVKQKGYLKLIPKRRVDLTEFFDKADLGIAPIGSWAVFEKRIAGSEEL
jgi:bifunctional DNA-binding transcriptional regulator/antitoxin component of YhaV-PrlF toxin-antitoxin module